MPNSQLPLEPTALPAGGTRAVIRNIGASDAYGNPAPGKTGRIVIVNGVDNRQGYIYLRGGRVYAAGLTGFKPAVALRMRSGGLVGDEALAYLLTVDPGRVGAESIEKGLCTEEAVEDIHRQLLMSTITHLYGWHNATWFWEPGVTTDVYNIAPLEPGLLVTAADERIGQWDALTRYFLPVTKGHAVPQPGAQWAAKTGEETTPEIASILSHVNGINTITDIATNCGFTRFEIGARLAKAIADGVLVILDPDGAQEVDARSDALDNEANIDPLQLELEDAEAMLVQARATLLAAEARLARAREAVSNAR